MPRLLKKERLGLGVLASAVFALILLLTWLTPLVADDYNYAFSWASEERIRSLGDVAASIRCHRIYTNGRVFSHGFVQLFSAAPHWAFALVNGAAAALEVLLLHRLLRRCRRPLAATAGTLMLLFVCMPAFGQVYLWQDGACNYAWGLLLALAMLNPFFDACEGERPLPLWGLLLALPLAFAAGAWSEHISFSLLAACALALVLAWHRSRRFPAGLAVLLLSGGLGYLYLVLAPSSLGGKSSRVLGLDGLLSRLEGLLERVPGGLWTLLGLALLALAALTLCLKKLGGRKTLGLGFALGSLALAGVIGLMGLKTLRAGEGIYGLISAAAVSLPAAYLCFTLPFALALLSRTEGKRLVLPALLFFSGLGSVALFALASYFPPRGSAVSVLFAVLGGVMAFDSLPLPRLKRAAAAAVVPAFVVCLALGTADILAVHGSELQRQELIRLAREGDGVLIAQPHPVRSKYSAQYGLADLNPEGDWPNDVMARYYELERILTPEETTIDNINEGEKNDD